MNNNSVLKPDERNHAFTARIFSEAHSGANEEPKDSSDEARVGLVCPNCGGPLEGRKCKLFCLRPGCGYLVTCSEW